VVERVRKAERGRLRKEAERVRGFREGE